ncbi:MAG: recombinase RecA [Muribaculaceae bacterium]|nr:recombinase RecA [Muribaculaceae bacterium]
MAKKKSATAKKAVRISDAEEKKKALEVALAHLEKDFGTGTIMRLGDNNVQDIETISTGSIGLDYALGVGGVPRGRITEIFGAESSGKTTLAIHVIAEAQKQGGVCAIIDAEHAFDRFYAEQLGVDVNNLWISQPDNGEQALEIAEQLINSGAVDVLVIDSVAALTPKAEIEGEMGDKNVGLQARLMSQAMRKLTGAIARTRTCCIFINQTREKIGNMYGPAQTTTGGNALKFYSTVRIEIAPSSMIKDSDEKPLGRVAKVKVVKNKVAPPFKKAEFDIMFGEGISKAGEIIEYGVELGVIKKSGAWFSYGTTKIGQGKEGVRKMLNDNPELMEELEQKVREAIESQSTDKKGVFISTKAPRKSAEEYEADDFDANLAAEDGDDFFEEDIEIEE